MGDLGLILAMSMDNTQALIDANEFGKSVETSLAGAGKAGAKAGADIEKGLINSHQSVHLLAEEMGIHLPRAVVGAVSEMLPAITAIGPALLGAFSVKELYEFEKGLGSIYDDFDHVREAAAVMADIGRENVRLIDELALTMPVRRLRTRCAESK